MNHINTCYVSAALDAAENRLAKFKKLLTLSPLQQFEYEMTLEIIKRAKEVLKENRENEKE